MSRWQHRTRKVEGSHECPPNKMGHEVHDNPDTPPLTVLLLALCTSSLHTNPLHTNSSTPTLSAPTLHTNSLHQLSTSTLCCNHAPTAMGTSWQTPEQKVIIEDHHASLAQHSASGTEKAEFWPEFLDEWFKTWPLPAPTPDQIEKEGGNAAKAARVECAKKVKVSTTCH